MNQVYTVGQNDQCMHQQFRVQKDSNQLMNIAAFLLLTTCLCLTALVSGYRLQGNWTLRTSQISELKGLVTPVSFSFIQAITNSTQIDRQLVVKGCRQLTYSYEVRQDELLLKYRSMGPFLRGCVSGQISYLRSKIDTIFYFYILDEVLLLLPPNGQLPVKLDRQVSSAVSSINGIWRLTDGVYFNKVTDPLVISNGAQFALCGGESSFTIKLIGSAQIEMKPQTVSKCNKILVDSLTKASLYRINYLKQPAVLSIFDKEVSLIAELTLDQPYIYGAKIDFTGVQLKSEAVDPFAALAWSFGLSSDPFASTSSVEDTHTTNSVSNNNIISASTKVNSSINSVTLSITTPTSIPETVSQPTTTVSSQAPSSNIIVAPSSFSQVTSASDLFGIWYPYQTSSLSSLNSYGPKAFDQYQIIINQARIMISGGCNTIFTSYSFSQGKLSNLNKVATRKSCPIDNDSVLSNIILASNVYYLGQSANAKMLQIKSPQGTLLLQLTDKAPKSQ